MLIRAVLVAWLLLASAVTATAATLAVPLTVTERYGTARSGEIVTIGVPLPVSSGLSTTDSLEVIDANGKVVPAQFRILSRWGRLTDTARPIRWVLVDFEATLPPTKTAIYTLKGGGASNAPIQGVSTSESAEMIVLDTGAATVRIPKGGGFLFETEVGGQTYRTSGIRILKGDLEFQSALAKPDSVSIDESGPLRTVVRISGPYSAADGTIFTGGDGRFGANEKGRPAAERRPLRYTVWLTGYRGKPVVRVRVRFENEGAPSFWNAYFPSNDVFIDGVYLDTQLPESETYKVAAAGKEVSLARSQHFSLLQTHSVRDQRDESKNFTFVAARDGEVLANGSRVDGWLGAAGSGSAVTVAVARFWQNYPKSLEFQGGRLSVGLWPAQGSMSEKGAYGRGRHFFSGGWHKTHDMILVYHGADPRGAGDHGDVMGLLSPVTALPSPDWIASTGAWGAIAPAGLKTADRELQEALDRYERYQRILIDPSASADGLTLERMREARGAKNHARTSWYGWQDFGDLMHGGNPGHPSHLIYDWPYIMWLHHLRTGDPRFRQVAEEMTDHSRDMDQLHTVPPFGFDGIWNWETGRDSRGYHTKVLATAAIVSHTWNGGYALGYLLTGDPTYLEATRRGAMAGKRFWEKRGILGKQIHYDSTRSHGWSILMLTNLHKIDGDPAHLEFAMRIFSDSLLFSECQPPPKGSNCGGYIPSTNQYVVAGERNKVVGTFATYHLEPLVEFAIEAKAGGINTDLVDEFLVRAVSWLKNYAFVGGTTARLGRYNPLTLTYATDPYNRHANRGGAIGYNTMVAGAATYVSRVLRSRDPKQSQMYLDWARQLFRDQIFYQEVKGLSKDSYIGPSTRSRIWWSNWPAVSPKVLGWIGRGGQLFLRSVWESTD